MLRSMYSGITGMRANQTKLDVIGNNISNVSTTGFKVSRTRFQDMLSQNVSSALAPSLNQGGVNPSKVGLGVKVAGIDTVVSQGAMQTTSRSLDVGIDGSGYFMVSKGPVVFDTGKINLSESDNSLNGTDKSDVYFTRDGSFTLDADGNLLTSDGYRVLGYSVSGMSATKVDSDGNVTAPTAVEESIKGNDTQVTGADNEPAGTVIFVDADSVDENGDSNLKATSGLRTLRIPDRIYDTANEKYIRIVNFTIEKDGLIKAVCEGGKVAVLGQIAMSSFKNPAGLEKLGSNLYRNSSNSGTPVVRTGIGAPTASGTDATGVLDNSSGYGDMLQGMLEMSNVDLAEQFTEMIVTSRAFQASGKMISTGDEILQDIINLKR